MIRLMFVLLALAIAAPGFTLSSFSAQSVYESRVSNDTTETFDGVAEGEFVSANHDFDIDTLFGDAVTVSSDFATTSGVHYLAEANSDRAFLASDQIVFQFDFPITALGVSVITEESLQAGDLRLVTEHGEVANSAIADELLADAQAYFVGFALDSGEAPVTQVTLESADSRMDFKLNIDDVRYFMPTPTPTATPESGGGGAFGAGWVFLVILGRLCIKKIRGVTS